MNKKVGRELTTLTVSARIGTAFVYFFFLCGYSVGALNSVLEDPPLPRGSLCPLCSCFAAASFLLRLVLV